MGEGHLKAQQSSDSCRVTVLNGLAEHLQTLCGSFGEAAEIHWLNWSNSSDEAWAVEQERWAAGGPANQIIPNFLGLWTYQRGRHPLQSGYLEVQWKAYRNAHRKWQDVCYGKLSLPKMAITTLFLCMLFWNLTTPLLSGKVYAPSFWMWAGPRDYLPSRMHLKAMLWPPRPVKCHAASAPLLGHSC